MQGGGDKLTLNTMQSGGLWVSLTRGQQESLRAGEGVLLLDRSAHILRLAAQRRFRALLISWFVNQA